MEFKDKLEVALLFDFYANLLTEKQSDYLSMHFFLDLSITEIAETKNVSRNAVFDQIKKTILLLKDYEKKLKLVENEKKRNDLYEMIREYPEIIEKLKNIR